MAHKINRKDGKDSIVYAGATPWHRLGQKVNEAFDAKTALREGGLDFTVEKTPIAVADSQMIIPGKFAMRRNDTKDVLGIVSTIYQPLQNRDAFAFFDGAFGKNKARYEVAGVLGKGEQVWLLAKLPGDFKIIGEDVCGKWLLLTNGHDGSETVRAKFTPIRVVCQNTLSLALRDGKHEVRVQHLGDVKGKLEIAGKLLTQAGVFFDEVQSVFQGFTKKSLKAADVRNFAVRVVAGDTAKYDDLAPITLKSVTEIERYHDTGRGHELRGVRGTLWGAYNAVTEWIDHSRTKGDIGYMACGRGREIKQRAFSVAQSLIVGAN